MRTSPFLAVALGLGMALPVAAQQTAEPLPLGAQAPDFELPAVTRFGVLRDHVKLSDFKGKTVVLAFFFKARTPG